MIANYANIQNKSKEDAAMVEKRKRMLQKFLNRLAKHEILSYEHVFHRFLETGVSWVCFALFLCSSTCPREECSFCWSCLPIEMSQD